MEHTAAVVVGLGGGHAPWPELDWAAHEAALRRRDLHVLRAFDSAEVGLPWDDGLDPAIVADLRHAEEERIRAAVVHVRRLRPELVVWGEVVEGSAADVLSAASAQAEVVVLGSRRLGEGDSVALGSVGAAVVAGATGVVVVLRGPGPEAERPADVVVGIDGSPRTDAVLAFAFDYASRHGRGLRAVYCFRPDLLATMQWSPEPAVPERADRWLGEAVAGWQEKYPDVAVRRVVLGEFPVAGLVAEARGQELLVVGGRAERDGLGILLGSVGQGVLHHASCPVAVVHPQLVATAAAG